MIKKQSKIHLFIGLLLLTVTCSSQDTSNTGLKDALEGKFLIGAAMNRPQILGTDTLAVRIIHEHFNSIVAENCMKSGRIQPKEGEFNFELPDKFVEFGEKNGMYIVGHCLIWHSQAPRWFFTDDEGNDVTPEVLTERMKKHIDAVAGRYKGRVDCWDVVNEAFEDDGSWRKNKFYQILGEKYVELAFQFAHEADPEAELLYNDFSMFHQGRREAVVKLVRDLREKGLQIDGVGMQAHWGMDHPPIDELEKSLLAFSEAGVDVHITELDVSALPNPFNFTGAEVSTRFEYRQKMNPYPNGLPDSASLAWHDRCLTFFKVFLNNADKIKRVTLWGVTDQHSWKNNFPIRGRTDYPLLFDREYQAKPVVQDIIEAADSMNDKD